MLDFPTSDAGQNEALSTIYASIDDNYPGIIPVFQDMHFLVTGANGSYVGLEQIAENVRFHTQSWDNEWEVVAVVKIWFEPIGSSYRVIVGSPSFRDVGLQQYAQFVLNGGTYLGAPKNYEPELSHFPY